ncbi:MAG: glycosyltransferase family 4 protein [Candidatus Omnitrophica bacterium]|nr:glycosyltransferase family 4 protein [Candidatus Omnitrophota bacterium]
MKIVLVSTFFYPESKAGAINYVYELAGVLKDAGHTIREFCGTLQSFHAPRFTQEETLIYRVALPGKDQPFYRYLSIDNPRVRKIFREFLIEEKPDIVHLHALQGLGASLVQEAKTLGIPVVATFHDGWWICAARFFYKHYNRTVCAGPQFFKCIVCQTRNEEMRPVIIAFLKNMFFLRTRSALMKKMLRQIDTCIVSSRDLFSRYCAYGLPEEKLRISSCGIDTQRFSGHAHPYDSSNIRLGFLSGYSEFKGYFILCAAMRLVKSRNYSLHIWGDVRHAPKDKLPQDKTILHHQFDRRQVAGVFSDIDVLIVPSLMVESWSLSVSEAFASEVPVIAVAAGGIVERMQDGETGLLFRHNDPQDLAEKINLLLTNPARIGELAKKIDKGKDIRMQVKELEEIYRTVIARKGSHAAH